MSEGDQRISQVSGRQRKGKEGGKGAFTPEKRDPLLSVYLNGGEGWLVERGVMKNMTRRRAFILLRFPNIKKSSRKDYEILKIFSSFY